MMRLTIFLLVCDTWSQFLRYSFLVCSLVLSKNCFIGMVTPPSRTWSPQKLIRSISPTINGGWWLVSPLIVAVVNMNNVSLSYRGDAVVVLIYLRAILRFSASMSNAVRSAESSWAERCDVWRWVGPIEGELHSLIDNGSQQLFLLAITW